MLLTELHQGQDVLRAVRGFREVEQLHSTIGEWDLVMHLRTRSIQQLDIAVERVRAVPGAKDTETSLLFNSLTR